MYPPAVEVGVPQFLVGAGSRLATQGPKREQRSQRKCVRHQRRGCRTSRGQPIYFLREREKWQDIAAIGSRACCEVQTSRTLVSSLETRMRLGICCSCGRWHCWRIHVSIVVQKYVAVTTVMAVMMMTRVDEWYMERTSNGGGRRATVKTKVLTAKCRNPLGAGELC